MALKPSEPTERDRELAYMVPESPEYNELAVLFAQARAEGAREEREVILAEAKRVREARAPYAETLFGRLMDSLNKEEWASLMLYRDSGHWINWIEARGKEGEANATS